jgi:hypothetical protein
MAMASWVCVKPWTELLPRRGQRQRTHRPFERRQCRRRPRYAGRLRGRDVIAPLFRSPNP